MLEDTSHMSAVMSVSNGKKGAELILLLLPFHNFFGLLRIL